MLLRRDQFQYVSLCNQYYRVREKMKKNSKKKMLGAAAGGGQRHCEFFLCGRGNEMGRATPFFEERLLAVEEEECPKQNTR